MGKDVRRHQDHLRRRPTKEQWGCFDQVGGSRNEGSSTSVETGAPQQLPPTQSSEEMVVPVPLEAPVPLGSVPTSHEKTIET